MLNNSYSGKIKPEFFSKMTESFSLYKEHKKALDRRIIENNRWFKARYCPNNLEIPEPTTPYIFNVIANKHADAMDNYPAPSVLERNESNRDIAETFTKILPLQMDLCGFKNTYSRAWWYKLKNGASCYGVFFNPSLRSGRGEIDIKKIDLLNIFWEPGITDIQDSKFLFVTALCDRDAMREKYPQFSDKFSGDSAMDAQTYDDLDGGSQADILKDKCLIVDCYYKKQRGNKQTVELIKFFDDTILDASEDRGERGIYEHGEYPFVLDVLYPDEDSPVGFGLVDIIKNPQMYIDKLDAIISKNAMISGKTRFMIKDNGGLNEYELTDLSKDIIHVAGSVGDENIRELQTKPLHSFIMQHRRNKIDELKEISGNMDFQQGNTTGGVTAYSAIVALQQAGEKLSRDMIAESYEAYRKIIYFCIELIRQFYDEPRTYRINKSDGDCEYIAFSNSSLRNGEHPDSAEFDIVISAEKNNPYSRITQNQTITDLWNMGLFRKETAQESILMLESLHLDGKEKLIEGMRKMLSQQNLTDNPEVVSGSDADR
ncbi:MAG: hypothetical protein IJA16_03645 [Clostridia bacterium]|nr:hypothetical protein [Clostridia bacterium]